MYYHQSLICYYSSTEKMMKSNNLLRNAHTLVYNILPLNRLRVLESAKNRHKNNKTG